MSLLGATGSIVQRSGPAPQRPQFTSTKTRCKRHITKINTKRHQDISRHIKPNPTRLVTYLHYLQDGLLSGTVPPDARLHVDMDISADLLGKSLRTAPCSRWANGNVPWTWQTSFSSDLKACNGHIRRQALRLRLCRIPLAKHVHQARLWDWNGSTKFLNEAYWYYIAYYCKQIRWEHVRPEACAGYVPGPQTMACGCAAQPCLHA